MKNLSVFLLMVIYIFSLVPYIYADSSDPVLLCLNKGDELKFSDCNPLIKDRICPDDRGCQYCVTEIRDGVYCPRNINDCNYAKLSCSYIENSSQDNSNDDSNQNNSTNDNSNSSNANSLTTHHKSNITSKPELLTGSAISQKSKSSDKIPFFFALSLLEIIALGFLLYAFRKKKLKNNSE